MGFHESTYSSIIDHPVDAGPQFEITVGFRNKSIEIKVEAARELQD